MRPATATRSSWRRDSNDITTTIDPGGKQVTIIGTVDGNGDPTSVLDGGNPVGGTSGVRVLICQNGETSTTVFQNLVIPERSRPPQAAECTTTTAPRP